MKTKKCPECGFVILGRADKVFCSDLCRTRYNNQKQKTQTGLIRKINQKLRKNWIILDGYRSKNDPVVTRKLLLESGFDFSLFTSTVEGFDHPPINYCYDIGYYSVDKNRIKLVFKK